MQLRHAATLFGRVGAMTEAQAGGCYWEGELAGEELSAFLRACMGRELALEAGSNRWRARALQCWYDVRLGKLLVRLALEPMVDA